jgi:hypothetical protein
LGDRLDLPIRPVGLHDMSRLSQALSDVACVVVMKTPLGRLGIAALALMGKSPAEEQTANLHRLKQILETGRVTDTRHAVAGKFGNA